MLGKYLNTYTQFTCLKRSIFTRNSGLLNFRSASTPWKTGLLFASSKNWGSTFLYLFKIIILNYKLHRLPPRLLTEMFVPGGKCSSLRKFLDIPVYHIYNFLLDLFTSFGSVKHYTYKTTIDRASCKARSSKAHHYFFSGTESSINCVKAINVLIHVIIRSSFRGRHL